MSLRITYLPEAEQDLLEGGLHGTQKRQKVWGGDLHLP